MKRYPDVVAVDGVDLEIAVGTCLGLLGPNGAGKTTVVEIIEGLTRPDQGYVEVFGMRWGAGADREIRQRIGVQLQETNLIDTLTVIELLRLFRSFYAQGDDPEEVLQRVSLQAKRSARFGKLSGGQKQRLALACALISRPGLLLLDEPSTGLDPQARLAIWEIVERFKQAGGTVLLTTHHMEEAAKLADRVAVMDHGKVIAEGTPESLIASLGAEQIIELEADRPLSEADLAQVPGVSAVRAGTTSFRLTVDAVATAMPRVLALVDASSANLVSLNTHRATLEDVFVHLTGRGLRDD